MTRKQNDVKGRIKKKELNQLLAEDRDLLNIIVEQTVQPVFEAKMEEALPGGKSERAERRLSYRAGCYSRTLIMPYQLIWMC